MRKFISAVLFSLLTLCLALPCFSRAEARTLALLPLINNVAERDDLGQIYYDRAVEAIKKAPDVEIGESQELDAAISKYTTQGNLVDQAACENIARDGNVDLVIMMQVDKLDYTDKGVSQQNDSILLYLTGKVAYYDVQTGKFVTRKIDDETVDYQDTLIRYDTPGNLFANVVTRQIKRILGVKKISIETPRITGAGLKGNRR